MDITEKIIYQCGMLFHVSCHHRIHSNVAEKNEMMMMHNNDYNRTKQDNNCSRFMCLDEKKSIKNNDNKMKKKKL